MARLTAAWAQCWGGTLDVPQGTSLADDGAGPEAGGAEHWERRPLLKRPARAIEKAVTCYGGDVSRLLDVCRARLVLEGLDGVTRCLRAVAATPGVRVVRIRNMLSPSHNVMATGGFRVRLGAWRFSVFSGCP